MNTMNGGDLVAEVLQRQGVPFLFTLCGGHISPILVGCKQRGIRVIDTRHEATAVFAADAVARRTGVPGVAAVTAGPGVTNTITAVKNAQLAQSPVVILGGATLLKGRGSLQDIDQLALFEPHVKLATTVARVRDLPVAVERAFEVALEGVPGPVFVECPVDLLYDEPVVREMFGAKAASDAKSLPDLALQTYLKFYLWRAFNGAQKTAFAKKIAPSMETAFAPTVRRAASMLSRAQKPVILVGSQSTLGGPERTQTLADALSAMGIPTFLSGMGRGLLGKEHPTWFRHKRTAALKEADVVVLAGVPCDFRLNYGLQIGRNAKIISVNRCDDDVRKNRRPSLAVVADPLDFLVRLRPHVKPNAAWRAWTDRLRTRDHERNEQIAEQAKDTPETYVNPLRIFTELDARLPDASALVADGGDFVATGSYVLRPRAPLSWLDPGVFGTLGVGGGFALGAKLCCPDDEVWLIYGDGSAGYSLAEFDTFARHGLGVIAIVGNDASWAQIARDQVDLLQDDVGTVLARTDYDRVAEGYGGVGLRIETASDVIPVLERAQQLAKTGKPVLINALLARSEFRKGSISM